MAGGSPYADAPGGVGWQRAAEVTLVVVEMNERMDEALYPQDDEDEEDDPAQNAP